MQAEQSEIDFTVTGIFSRLGSVAYAQLLEIIRGRTEVYVVSIGQQLSMHLPRLASEEITSEAAVLAEAERLASFPDPRL